MNFWEKISLIYFIKRCIANTILLFMFDNTYQATYRTRTNTPNKCMEPKQS